MNHRTLILGVMAFVACGDDGTEATSTNGSTGSSSETGATTTSSSSSESTSSSEGESTAEASTDASTESTGASSSSSSSTTGEENAEPVNVQIVAFNDFHGNLLSPGNFQGVSAGGAAALAYHVNRLRAEQPNTLVVSAGDLIGASPLASALYHDEPTIEVMDMIGLDLNAVGNHEFDEGFEELVRMQVGGCHPVDGCRGPADGFDGAGFQFLAANVPVIRNGRTLFPAYSIQSFEGVQVAFVGMTLEGTPEIVTPSGVSGLAFLDEIETVNALVPELQAAGVEAIVIVVHEGGAQAGGIDECTDLAGAIVDIVNGVDDAVDVFISGHTHQAYNCEIDGKLVTSASSFGRVLTDIDLAIDPISGDVVAKSAQNFVITREFESTAVRDYVQSFVDDSAALANLEIGRITATLDRVVAANGQSTLGAVVADAQLAAAAGPEDGTAVAAFMNPGGLRADLFFAASGEEIEDGIVTYGEAFTTQPFGNSLVVMTLTGAQIDTLLETQFQVNRILQVSAGFTYSFSLSAPVGDKIAPGAIAVDGAVLAPSDEIRVVVNSFLATGGDGFTVLNEGTDRLGGDLDLDALQVYFDAFSPVAPPADIRVTALP